MKSLAIIISFFLSCMICNAQNGNRNDSIKYIVAYNYIVNDSINKEKSMNVSDSVVRLNFAVFFRELRQVNEDEGALFTRLYKMHQDVDNPISLSFLNNKGHNGEIKGIVFFSPIIDDSILCADLFDAKNCLVESSYTRVAMYNTSHTYLFIFNEIGEIKSVFRKEMIYD